MPFSYSNIQSDLLNSIGLFIALSVMFLLNIKYEDKKQEGSIILNDADRYRINGIIINDRTTNKDAGIQAGIKAGLIILVCNKAAELLINFIYKL